MFEKNVSNKLNKLSNFWLTYVVDGYLYRVASPKRGSQFTFKVPTTLKNCYIRSGIDRKGEYEKVKTFKALCEALQDAPAIPADTVVTLPELFENLGTFTPVDAPRFIEAIETVQHAVALDDNRPSLCCAMFNPDSYLAVAADGYRAAKSGKGIFNNSECIGIQYHDISRLLKIAKGAKTFGILQNGYSVYYQVDDCLFLCTGQTGLFPDIDMVMKSKENHKIKPYLVIDKYLKKSLLDIKLTGLTTIDIENDGLIVKSGEEILFTAIIPAVPFMAATNFFYLQDVLRACKGAVVLQVKGNETFGNSVFATPLHVFDGDNHFMIMPVAREK